MEEKIVLSYPAEMEDDCLNWSYDQIGNIKADHWVARVITCLGVAGFIYNVKNVDYAQVFAVLIAIGCIRLLSLRLQKSAYLRSTIKMRTEQPYENKKILCESGILSELGKRSWRGVRLILRKNKLILISWVAIYLIVPKKMLGEEDIAKIRRWIQTANGHKTREDSDSAGIDWNEVRKMKFLGFIHLGTPVLGMAFSFVFTVVSIVLFRSVEGVLWRTLIGLELGFCLYWIIYIALSACRECFWTVAEDMERDPAAKEMEVFRRVFPSAEGPVNWTELIRSHPEEVNIIPCKHGRILMFGHRRYFVQYEGCDRLL